MQLILVITAVAAIVSGSIMMNVSVSSQLLAGSVTVTKYVPAAKPTWFWLLIFAAPTLGLH